MSILAIVGVIVSSAAMLVVLSGFSGLKDYSLEFISFVSPELKITSAKGKSFEFFSEQCKSKNGNRFVLWRERERKRL